MRNFLKITIGSQTYLFQGLYIHSCSSVTITGEAAMLEDLYKAFIRSSQIWRVEFEGDGFRESLKGSFAINMTNKAIILEKRK